MHSDLARLQCIQIRDAPGRARVSDDSVIRDATTETCDLRISVLHVGASRMRLSHVVRDSSGGSSKTGGEMLGCYFRTKQHGRG
jgi:hypothetical protein